MLNFRESKTKQPASRNAALVLMRTVLTACTAGIYVPGIRVCKHKEAAP